MPLRILPLIAFAASLVACAPISVSQQPGEMTMTITTIIDSTTGASLNGDVYLDDQLVAKAVSHATFSLGPLLHERIVRVEAPNYLRWRVAVRRHNPSERAHSISGPVKLTSLYQHRPAVPASPRWSKLC